MRVGLDVSGIDPHFKEHSGRGIGRYVRGLQSGLETVIDPEVNVQIGEFNYRDFLLPDWIEQVISRLPAGRQTVRQQLCYPFQIDRLGRSKGFDFMHFPAQMDAPSWSRFPCVVTVLDLIPLVCQDLYRDQVGGLRFKFARWLELTAIRRALLIFAISENTAQDVHRLLGVPLERICVTPLGIEDHFFESAKESVVRSFCSKHNLNPTPNLTPGRKHSPIISYLGGIDPRKRVIPLLDIFARLVAERRSHNAELPTLVIAGRIEKDRNFPLLQARIADLELQDRVVLTGYVSDEDVRALFEISSLFVFPSQYEGFGLPPLEAMAYGVPVLSAKNSCLPDVLGSNAHWFDVERVPEATDQLHKLLEDHDLRTAFVNSGRQHARGFTWSNTAKLTLEGYREAYSRLRLASV